jgi:tRNA A-37 threonylcarbamoyl transferase component Bud32/tetratricopeptide (TPR) repeat protein
MEHHRIGPYFIVSVLGAGGMGVVYRAVEPGTGRAVALKVAKVRPTARRALELEIQALSRLRHPGIVRILDHGEQDGEAWIATELVEGRPLRQQLVESHPSSGAAPSTLSMEDLAGPSAGASEDRVVWERGALLVALSVFRRMCTPLAYLHGEGLVHGDLKPENVIVREDGSIVLVDFGLFRSFGAEGRDVLQVQQQVMGTAGYLSPEQRYIRVPDARSDLYAVGCMLYETLTGRRPFGRSVDHGPAPVQPPSELADLPPELDTLVLSLLEWDPRRRMSYAADLGEALERLGVAPDPSPAPPARISLVRPALVGRQRELALAREAPAVVVVGEPGCGKTRLLAELGEALDAPALGADSRSEGGVVPALLRALAAACPDEERAEDWFEQGGPVLVGLEPSLRALPCLAHMPAPEPLPPASALTRAAVSVVRALTAAAPLRLLVDDLDRADELAMRVVTGLMRRRVRGVRIAASAAPQAPVIQPLVEAGAQLVRLDPLDEPTVSALLSEQLGGEAVLPELDAYVRGHAGGNPRFATEYLRLLVDEGHLARRRRQWVVVAREGLGALPVPAGMEELALRRLSGLSERSRAAAEQATVLDPSVLPSEALSELIYAHVLEIVQDQPRWTLPALREVLYARMPAARRAELHELALQSLPPDAPLPARALHLERAGRREEARQAWLRAGIEADEASRWAEGVSYLQAAQVLPIDARLRLSRMLRFRGKLDESVAEADRVLASEESSPQQRRVAALLRAKVLSRQAEHAQATASMAALAEEARQQGALRWEAQVLDALAEAQGDSGDLVSSVAIRRRAVACWEEDGSPTELAEARMSLANSLQRQDRLVEAESLLDQAIPVLISAGRALAGANALATLALVRGSQGDWPRAEAAAREALATFRRLGVLLTEAQALIILAEALRHQGQREACLACLAEAQGIAAELGQPRLEAMIDYNFAITELHFGRPDAEAALERAVPLCRASQLSGPEADLLLHLARLHRVAGRWERVSLDRAAQLAEQRGDLGLQFRVACERGLLALHTGGDARAALAQAEALSQAMGGARSHRSAFEALRRALDSGAPSD